MRIKQVLAPQQQAARHLMVVVHCVKRLEQVCTHSSQRSAYSSQRSASDLFSLALKMIAARTHHSSQPPRQATRGGLHNMAVSHRVKRLKQVREDAIARLMDYM